MNIYPIITEITPSVLQGAMDMHAERIAIAFLEWVEKHKLISHYSYIGKAEDLFVIFKDHLLKNNQND